VERVHAESTTLWIQDSMGHLRSLRLGTHADPYSLTYDPANGLMYVCGAGTDTLYVVG
jgi:DNA-binding beta-propeller fold protein YncE